MTHGADIVDVRYLKWPDRPHWRYTLTRFATDDHGTWLGAPAGHTVRRADEPPVTFEHPWVQLVTDGGWSMPIWNAGSRYQVYVDVVMPPRWDGGSLTAVDLDLDVVLLRDGSIEVLDEDEFLDHQQRYGYPPQLVDRARTTTAAVVLDLKRGAEPFGAAGPARLAEWVAGLG